MDIKKSVLVRLSQSIIDKLEECGKEYGSPTRGNLLSILINEKYKQITSKKEDISNV